MLMTKIYNQEGKEVSELKLNEAIFDLPWNADLVHQVVRIALANQRQVLASTKGRSEVSGGGRKPWRQKGTGRARAGSIRSPLWKGGGVTFGPTSERNFKLNINKHFFLGKNRCYRPIRSHSCRAISRIGTITTPPDKIGVCIRCSRQSHLSIYRIALTTISIVTRKYRINISRNYRPTALASSGGDV